MLESEKYVNVILGGGTVTLADGTVLYGASLANPKRPIFYGKDRYGNPVFYKDGEELIGPYYMELPR